MPDYKQMLKEAEAREEAVKAVFKKYDHDGSGTIDDALKSPASWRTWGCSRAYRAR